MNAKSERIEILDSLRGIAALCVFLFHTTVNSIFMHWQLIRKSYLFVDLFFILSGFVISLNYLNKIRGLSEIKGFLKKRLLRIYPLHLLTLTFFLIVEVIRYVSYNFSSAVTTNAPFSQNSWKAFFANLFLLQTIQQEFVLTFNFPSWSIGTELYTYGLFALFVVLISRIQIKSKERLFFFISLSGYGLIYLKNGPLLSVESIFLFIRTIAGFFLGVGLCEIYRKYSQKISINGSTFLLILSLVIAVLSQKLFVLVDYAMPVLFSVLITACVFLKSGSVKNFMLHPYLKWLGEISYSVYMTHAIVLWFNKHLFKYIYIHFNKDVADSYSNSIIHPFVGTIDTILVAIIVLWISSFTYKNIELRFYRKR